MQWYYWVIILGVLVVMYALLIVRQKRQEKQSRELLDTFKPGDKVLTHIGVYGKIKRIYNTTYGRVCVLEVGTLNKIDLELDMRYIAGKDEKTIVPDEPKPEVKEPEVKEVEVKEEIVEDANQKAKPEKKPTKKSTNQKTNKTKKQ